VVVERTAFSRAKAYLDHASRSKWLALSAGTAAGLCYVALALIFALFVDLLDTRGRIPNFAQLGLSEQDRFQEIWKELPEQSRLDALAQVGLVPLDPASAEPVTAEHRRRSEMRKSLAATENLPPVPGRMNPDDLRKWAGTRTDDAPYVAAMRENELRWRAYLWLYLRDHVSRDAADTVQGFVGPGEPLPLPGLGEENRSPHGVLALVVRLRSTFGGRLVNEMATLNPWMWHGTGGRDPNRQYLLGLLLLAVVAVFIAIGCTILMNWKAGRATLEAILRLRRALYQHSSRQSDLAVRSNGTPEAAGLFTKQVEVVHDSLYSWLTSISRYPAQIVLLLGLAMVVQPLLTLAVVLCAVLIWLVGEQLAIALRAPGRQSLRFAASRLALMVESIKQMRLVKSCSMELFNQNRVERQLSEYTRAYWSKYRGEALARPLVLLLLLLSVITLLYVAGRIVLVDGLSLSGLSIFVVAVVGIYPPLRGWQSLSRHVRRGNDAAASVFAYLDRKTDQQALADGEFLQPMTRTLEFKGVSLRQPGDTRMILTNVNLGVKVGHRISIMGADEEARKALLYLIPRFFEPTDGEVRIDGRNLGYVSLDSLRSQIGMVMQGSLVFNDTVANNIGCGDPAITLPRIIEAAKLAHAHQFIQNLPYGYETPIGDLGKSLRIGEQFRIALARAIVRDPAIYIIEEPDAPLDDDTKALIDDTLGRVLPGKTAFFLPHRISTLKHSDRIVLLHNGSIEAIGGHRELVHESSLYKHLYYLQFNAFAET